MKWFSRHFIVLAGALAFSPACIKSSQSESPILYPFIEGDRWGFIDATGKWVIEPQFDRCLEVFSGDVSSVMTGGKWGLIGRDGSWHVEATLDRPLVGFNDRSLSEALVGGKAGLLRRDGSWLLPAEFDEMVVGARRAWCRRGAKAELFEIEHAGEKISERNWPTEQRLPGFTQSDAAWYEEDGKWGLFSSEGIVISEPRFESHEMGRNDYEEWLRPEGIDFSNDRAWVRTDGKLCLLTLAGSILYETAAVSVSPWGPTAFRVAGEGRQWIVGRDGRIVIQPRFSEIGDLIENRAVLIERIDTPRSDGSTDTQWIYGYCDGEGKIIVEPGSYHGPGAYGGGQTQLVPFTDGLAPVWINEPESSKRQVYDPVAGFIDRDGKIAIAFRYFFTKPFSGGLAAVCERRPRRSGLSPEAGLWGYVDTSGTEVIPPRFGMATAFCRDRAWVLEPGARWDESRWAMIDRAGTVLTGFQYDSPERRSHFPDAATEHLEEARWIGPYAILARGDVHKGLAAADGRVLVEPRFNTIRRFYHGIAVATDSRERDEKGNIIFKTVLIRENGELVEGLDYTEMSDFEDGFSWATRRKRGATSYAGWIRVDTSLREINKSPVLPVSWVWGPDWTGDSSRPPFYFGELCPVVSADGYRNDANPAGEVNSWGWMDRSGKVVAWRAADQ
jgi:hypothetical protein